MQIKSARSSGNRGNALEEMVKWSNLQYLQKGIARIDKISTPVKVLKKTANYITLGFYEEKSTVDFVGTVKGGKTICFDCKETEENFLPLKNIKEHQIEYMKDIHEMGGYSFLIVSFTKEFKTFVIPYEIVKDYWDLWKINPKRKGFANIPRQEFRNEVKQGQGVALDYLKGVVY